METLPFEIGETAHALRKAFDRRAVGLGVTRAQWKVLFRLTRTPGLRQVELADMLDVEPITLCRIVDRLEEAGLVERTPRSGGPPRLAASCHREGAAAGREAQRVGAELVERGVCRNRPERHRNRAASARAGARKRRPLRTR